MSRTHINDRYLISAYFALSVDYYRTCDDNIQDVLSPSIYLEIAPTVHTSWGRCMTKQGTPGQVKAKTVHNSSFASITHKHCPPTPAPDATRSPVVGNRSRPEAVCGVWTP